MTTDGLDSTALLGSWRHEVQAALPDVMDEVLAGLDVDGAGGDLAPLATAIRAAVLGGGKRLRPLFCLAGAAAAGQAPGPAHVRVAAALELLQAAALVHDDVIDASETRRGVPATHRAFTDLHLAGSWLGDAQAFGRAAAILAGDLLLSGAVTTVATSGLDDRALARVWPVWRSMVGELTAGQYLDVHAHATGVDSLERALLVTRLKAAAYTIARPLELGAAIAGGGPDTVAVLTSYGIALGEAFQLRDDVLGVFGDPDVTGKPAGDDVREGKRTALVLLATERTDAAGRAVLAGTVGNPGLDAAGLDAARRVVVDSGALDEVERMVAVRAATALGALAGDALHPTGRAVLHALADAATSRAG